MQAELQGTSSSLPSFEPEHMREFGMVFGKTVAQRWDKQIVRSALVCGLAFQLSFAEPTVALSDSRSDAAVSSDPAGDLLPYFTSLVKPAAETVRFLTTDEQELFHRALWRSVKIIDSAGDL
jgi:hypothetical protein